MQPQNLPARSAAATVVFVLAVASLAGLVAVPGATADMHGPAVSVTPGKVVVTDADAAGKSLTVTVTNNAQVTGISLVRFEAPSSGPSLHLVGGTVTETVADMNWEWELEEVVDPNDNSIIRALEYTAPTDGKPAIFPTQSLQFPISITLTDAEDREDIKLAVITDDLIVESGAVDATPAFDNTNIMIRVEEEPYIVSATTRDLDSDGFIDAYEIKYDKSLDETSFDKNDWSVGSGQYDNIDKGAGSGGDKLILTFDESNSPDTNHRPALTYSGTSILGLHGTAAVSESIGEDGSKLLDGAGPAVVSAATVDDDGPEGIPDGTLDAYRVTLSEDIGEVNNAAAWLVDGIQASSIDDTTIEDNVIVIPFPNGVDASTGDLPELTYMKSGGDVQDLASQPMVDLAEARDVEEDDAAPVALSVTTGDSGADGKIDQIIVAFSEPIATVLGADDFELDDDYAIQSIDKDGADLVLTLVSDDDHDTDKTPAVTYVGSDDLADATGLPLDNEIPGTTLDGAPPVLLHAFILVGSPVLQAVFSENVQSALGDPLGPSAFAPWDGKSTSSVDHDLDDPVVRITFNEDFGEEDKDATFSVEENGVFDTAPSPNAAAPDPKDVSIKQLAIASALTRDLFEDDGTPGANGLIDAIDVEFNIDIKGSIGEAVDGWTVAGRTIDPVKNVQITGQKQITIYLEEGDVPDTGDTPTFSYTRNDNDLLWDAATEVSLQSFNDEPAIDGANVVFIGAQTVDGIDGDPDGDIDAVRITFSEVLDDGNFDETHWTVTTPAGTVSLAGSDFSADDKSLLFLIFENSLPGTGHKPTISYAVPTGDDRLEPVGEDASALVDFTATAADNAPPLLLSATGNPGDESVLLTFSETVEGSGPGDAIAPKDLVYGDTNEDGAGAISGVEYGGTSVEVFLDAELSPEELGIGSDPAPDTIAVKKGVTDGNGLPALTDPVGLADVEAPTIKTATTGDTTGDGRIDEIVLVFSEELEGTLDTGTFGVDGYEIIADDSSHSDDTITLVVESEDADLIDTRDTPEVSYTGDDFTDLAAKKLETFDFIPEDGALPVAVSATTIDDDALSNGIGTEDGNGHINAYRVKFSEPVSATAGGWLVDGHDNANVQGSNFIGGDEILIVFDEAEDADTGSRPDISYDALLGDVKDDAGNFAGSFDLLAADAGALLDGAAPILMRVVGHEGSDQVTAHFSEAVDNGDGLALTKEALTYINENRDQSSDGARRIQSILHDDPFDTVTLTLDGSLTADDMQDKIAPADGLVVAGGLDAPANAVAFKDIVPPEVVAMYTHDEGDGHVDQVIIEFNEVIDGQASSVDPDDFEIADYNIASSIIDGRTIRLTLAVDTELPFDTDAAPVITFTPDGTVIYDNAGIAWVPDLPATAADAAPPIIVAALGTEDSPYLDVLFSEPVTKEDGAPLDAAAFTYEVDGDTQELELIDADEDGVRLMTKDGPLDFENGGVSAAVLDAAGLPAGASKAVETYPAIEPAQVRTVDATADGVLDAIHVIFDGVEFDDGVLETDAWTVDGFVVHSATATGDTVVLFLTEEEADTAAMPAVRYTRPAEDALTADGVPVPSFQSLDGGDQSCPFDSTLLCTLDGAPPALVAAIGNPGTSEVILRFSEPIERDLVLMDLLYADQSGQSQIEDLSDADTSDKDVKLSLLQPLAFEDLGVHQAGVKAGLPDTAEPPNLGQERVLALEDSDAPSIVSIETLDGTWNGWIDSVWVTLSESFDHATLPMPNEPHGFLVDGSDEGVEIMAVHLVEPKFLLGFPESNKEGGDTDATPTISYDATGGITDQTGNVLEEYEGTADDGAAPVVMDALTVGDGMGSIEAYEITFSESIKAGAETAGWSVAGVAASSVQQDALAPNRLVVEFDGQALGFGTGEAPELTYTGSTVVDLQDKPLRAVTGDGGQNDVLEGDGAPPVLLHADVQPGSDSVEVLFSEIVHNGALAKLTPKRFAYDGGAPGEGIVSVDHTARTSRAVLTLEAPAQIGAPLAVAGVVADEAGLTSALDSVFIKDLTPPSFVSVSTDDDGDGLIDRVIVEFDEDLQFEIDDRLVGYEDGDFEVRGYIVTAVTRGGSASEVELTIESLDGSVEGDTDATPAISYDSFRGSGDSSIKDANGNPLTAFDPVAATDRAVPVLMGVQTRDTAPDGFLDQVVLTFSEEVDFNNLEDADLTVDGYDVTGFAGQDDVLKVGIVQDAADPVPDTDEVPTVSYNPASGGSDDPFKDLQSNVAGSFIGAGSADGAAPYPYSVVTRDDGDGVLDQIVITFSEDIDAPAFADGDFTVAGFGAVEIDSQAGDEVTLTIAGTGDGSAPRGTGLEPQVTYTSPAAEADRQADVEGNAVPSFVLDAEDGAAPLVLGAKTIDADGNGILDGYFVSFSETVDDSTFDAADWSTGGRDGTGLRTGTPDDDNFIVEFAEADAGTGELPELVYTKPQAGGFADTSGNLLAAIAGGDLVEEDGAPPAIVDAYTVDSEPNGFVDAIEVVFSEPINSDSFEAAEFMEDLWWWKSPIEGGTTLTGDTVTITVEEGYEWHGELLKAFDTDATLLFLYEPQVGDTQGPVTDLSGVAFDGSEIRVRDGADPILVAANIVGDHTVEATFSEPVFADGGALGVGDFTFTNAGGDGAEQVLDSVGHEAGDGVAVLTFTGPAFAPEDEDALAAHAGAITDAMEHEAPTEAVDLNVLPYIVSATSMDTMDNGFIDAIRIELSVDVDDVAADETSNLVPEHWILLFEDEGWDDGVEMVTSLEEGTGADDNVIYWKASPACWDDGHGVECLADMPGMEMAYFGDSIHALDDAEKTLLPNNFVPVVDGIHPAIGGAETADVDGDGVLDLVRVSFSEAVTGDFDASEWTVGNGITPDAATFSDGTLTLALPPDAGLDTGATPLVSYENANGAHIVDLAAPGNALSDAEAPPSTDGAAPVLLSAASSGPGKKEVTLTFSEPVEGSGSGGDVVLADLMYSGGSDGATAIAAIDSVDGNVLVVVLDEGFAPGLDATDAIGPAASLTDSAAAPNPATGSLSIDVDAIAPDQIDDLAVVTAGLTANSVKLDWSPVGDDGTSGTPDHYEVYRYSAAITAANLDSATKVPAQSLSFAPAALLSGSSTDAQTVVVSGLTKTTQYHFAVRAVDEAGNAGALSASVEATTTDDTTPPQGTLTVTSTTHTAGSPSNLDDATLSWNALTDGQSAVAYYTAVNDDDDHVVTTADDFAPQRSLALTNLADGTHYVHVAAISGGGTKQADAFELVIDTEAPDEIEDLEASDETPVSITLTWTAPGDDGDDGTAANYQIYRSTSAFTATDLDDATLVSGVVSPAVAGTAQSFEVTGLVPDTEYHFAIRARDDAGNAGALSDLVVAETDPDTTPPTGDLGLRSTSHTEAASFIRDVSFAWDAASDDEADVRYRYALVQGEEYALSAFDESTTQTSVTLEDVEPGQWTFFVAAESAGGRGAMESLSVVLLAMTEEDLEEANKKVVTKVTRKGDTNVIQWSLPKVPGDVAGVQVLRSNSPYQVIATIASDGDAFTSRSFADDSEEALETSKYLVTMYFGESESLGKQPEGQDIEVAEALRDGGVLPVQESPSIFSHSALYIGLVGVLAMISLAVFAVIRHQRRPMEGESA